MENTMHEKNMKATLNSAIVVFDILISEPAKGPWHWWIRSYLQPVKLDSTNTPVNITALEKSFHQQVT